LLIKHQDAFAVSGNGAAVLDDNDTSVASARSMQMIAAGKGRKPRPFMIETDAIAADAVWDSSHGLAAKKREKNKRMSETVTSTSATMPDFVPPQLCETRDRPPASKNWIHEIKFDGYRSHIENPKGSRLDRKISSHCKKRGSTPRRHHRWGNLRAGRKWST
jgi:bifunctional non-homologous end joining protein LigD